MKYIMDRIYLGGMRGIGVVFTIGLVQYLENNPINVISLLLAIVSVLFLGVPKNR